LRDPSYHYTLANTFRTQGRTSDAIAHYERALEIDPNHAGAHNNLGVALAAQGRIADAISHFQRAVAIRPDYANAHSNLGMALASQGRIADAVPQLERALALNPSHGDAHNNLGLALAAQGRIGEAIVQFEHTLVLNPGHAIAHSNLGSALAGQGRIADGIAHLEHALRLNPGHAEIHAGLGVVLARQGRIAEAIAHYERALALSPGLASAHSNLGVALAEEGKFADAMIHLERALALSPDHPDMHNNLGAALFAQGRIADAIAHYERALNLKPDHADAHCNLGTALAEQGRIADAMNHLERALALNPNHADALNTLGNICKHGGRFDHALAHYEKAIAIRPDYGQAHLNRSEIKSFPRGDAELEALDVLAGRDDLAAINSLNIHFALANAFEDSGDYPRAFEHLRKGNALKRSKIVYDEAETGTTFRRVSTVFTSNLLDRLQGAGDPSPAPIFVLGMPRSGSTLIEQILASHPQIHGAGELTDFDGAASDVLRSAGRADEYPECVPALDGDMLRHIGQAYLARLPALAEGKVRIVNKLPGNFLYIGLIRLALPNARIIHTMRHPVDTCVSCYSKLFTFGHHYTYDLAELGRFYRYYDELMTHWRSVLPPGAMLDVSYEDVVDDLEGQARRLIDYCGLAWDERCTSFYKTSRPVRTASTVQVRKPIFRSSLQRWRKYESGIAPLLDELRKISRVTGLVR